MTFIVSAVAHGCAFQVGDRLVSRERPGAALSEHDPEANKHVVVVTHDAAFSIGYTGLAYIGNIPTDEFIASAILERPVGGAIMSNSPVGPAYLAVQRVRRALNEAFARHRLWQTGHAYSHELAITGISEGTADASHH